LTTVASRRTSFALALAFAGALVAGAFSPSYAFLDKTRFVAHLGVAYFCFHHWVLKPYQEGAFAEGAPHRISSLVKAGAALLFAVHEVQVAEKIAKTSSDPLLQKIDSQLVVLTTQFGAIGAKLKSGTFDPKDIDLLKSLTAAVGVAAAADHAVIKDVPIPDLGSSSASPAPSPAVSASP
jgi:hypothetical protein